MSTHFLECVWSRAVVGGWFLGLPLSPRLRPGRRPAWLRIHRSPASPKGAVEAFPSIACLPELAQSQPIWLQALSRSRMVASLVPGSHSSSH